MQTKDNLATKAFLIAKHKVPELFTRWRAPTAAKTFKNIINNSIPNRDNLSNLFTLLEDITSSRPWGRRPYLDKREPTTQTQTGYLALGHLKLAVLFLLSDEPDFHSIGKHLNSAVQALRRSKSATRSLPQLEISL